MYRIVDDYYRQEIFDFYRRSRNPFYSLTFELEVAPLKRFLDERGHGIYLNLCYFFTRALQPLEDFHYRLVDGEIVCYEVIHPSLTYPAADGLFSFVDLTYDPDVDRFNDRARELLPSADEPARLAPSDHDNAVYFTAIPGVPFTSFAHASDDPTNAAPRVAFGRFVRQGDSLRVPVGIQVNHLFIDGRALGELYERARESFGNPTEHLDP